MSVSSIAMEGSGSQGLGSLYRLASLGDGGVGKTALTIQLCLNQFVETYDPTIEDSYRKKVVLDGEPTTIEVLDTAGQEEYTALRDQWIRDGEGFLLVYSITSRSSFSRIKTYYNQILTVKDGVPFGAVLVGNMSDRTSERQVAVQEGEQLAKELDIQFFEASAKTGANAESAFMACARATRDLRLLEGQRSDDQLDDVPATVATEPMAVLPTPAKGYISANTETVPPPLVDSMPALALSASGAGAASDMVKTPLGDRQRSSYGPLADNSAHQTATDTGSLSEISQTNGSGPRQRKNRLSRAKDRCVQM